MILNRIIKVPKQYSFLLKTNFEAKKMSIDIGGMRKAYKDKSEAFLEEHIAVKDPIHLFKQWFDEICAGKKIIEPNAMCLATATKEGKPSARFVLLKGFGPEGFKFFTHYTSRKGQELEENPSAALTFFWDAYERSVRIEGTAQKLGIEEADYYFHNRPKVSQIGALSSNQSTAIAGRQVLVKKEIELTEKYRDTDVPRPVQWGGYLVVPETIEFWQGQTDRLHDRIKFKKQKKWDQVDGVLLHQGDNGWVYERLSP